VPYHGYPRLPASTSIYSYTSLRWHFGPAAINFEGIACGPRCVHAPGLI